MTGLLLGGMALAGAGAIISAYGQYQNIKADAAILKYESEIADNNSKLAEMKAADVREKGFLAANRHRLIAAGQLSGVKTAYAASGVELTSGTVENVIGDIAAAGETEAVEIMQNSLMDVWGLQQTAADYRTQSGIYEQRSRDKLRQAGPVVAGTLLSGFGNMFALAGAGKR